MYSAQAISTGPCSTDWPALMLPLRLETRRVGNDLCIRALPDQAFVDSHRQILTKDERACGLPLSSLIGESDWLTDTAKFETARGEWRELARRYGPNRSAWILESILRNPNNPVSNDQSDFVPLLFLLPERLVYFLYENGSLAYQEFGKDIVPDLPIQPSATNEVEKSPPKDGWFDAKSKWVTDFQAAVDAGLAIRVPLRREHRVQTDLRFSEIVVVGLRKSAPPGSEPPLARFVRSHRFTEGFEFLPYGTPTNNTSQSTSAHSDAEDELLASFEHDVLSPVAGVTGAALSGTAYAQLSRALGLFSRSTPDIVDNSPATRGMDSRVLAHIKGSDLLNDAPQPHLLSTLWPTTGDYFFSTMLGYDTLADGRTKLVEHVTRYLRPRGPLAAVRIGVQPYGILPVTRVRATKTEPVGWKPSFPDLARGTDSQKSVSFEVALYSALNSLLPRWLARAADASAVPRVASGGDQDEEILQLMGMAPHSLDYRIRPIVDQPMVGILLLLFGKTLFGSTSSFGGLTDEQGAVAAWVRAKELVTASNLALLESMGAGQARDSLLLRAFAWGNGASLDMPLVRDPDNLEDGPEAYLPLLFERGADASPDASKTLLYELIRRSYLLASGSKPATSPIHEALIHLRDPVFEFFNGPLQSRAIDKLAFGKPKADPLPDPAVCRDLSARLIQAQALLPGGKFKKMSEIDAVFANDLVLRNNLTSKLRADFDQRLEMGLRDVIDSLTFRLDAWFTSLATRRLAAMRDRNPEGIHLGAYGYLEDIRLGAPPPTDVEGASTSNGGFIHAPSVAHASAAAIARSAFEAHRYDEDGNAYALNLSSDRVNRALGLIDGVQRHQDLSALLGYQFESGSHANSLDRLIDDFRAAFPFTAPDQEPASDASAESIAARNVCNGRELSLAFSAGNGAIEAILRGLNMDDRETLRGLLADLADSTDAVGDVCLFEGIHQAVQGNFDRSGAALDASVGVGRPPEIESMATPSGGMTLRHRMLLFLPPEPAPTNASGARAVAEPRLNAWISGILGPLTGIGCRAYVTLPNGTALDPIDVTLDKLTPHLFSHLDFLYACSVLPDGTGNTEIELRIRRYVRSSTSFDQAATIRLNVGQGPTDFALDHAMELGRTILDMLGNAAPLRPASLTHPDLAAAPSFQAPTDITTLVARAEVVQQMLSNQVENLDSGDETKVRSALDICASFGIQEALGDSEDTPSVLMRGKRVAVIANQRLASAAPFIAAAKPARSSAPQGSDEKLKAVTDAFKALLGKNFVVLPTFNASMLDQSHVAAFGEATIAPPSEDRIWLWLQQVAETHPHVRSFETFLMAAQAWGRLSSDSGFSGLKVAQLTPGANHPNAEYDWQALADSEFRGTAGRARGAQSIVAMGPDSLDMTQVAGFMIDEWVETMAASTVTTGISFEYNQPASQAPQCILLAVPGSFDNPNWTAEHLAEIVRDTMALAKARLVDLDALPAVAGVFPAIMLPVTPSTKHGNATPRAPERSPAPVSVSPP